MTEKLQIVLGGKKRGFKSKAPSDEQLLTEYVNMTAKEIGEKYGVAESTVRGWIQGARRRIKERMSSEAD